MKRHRISFIPIRSRSGLPLLTAALASLGFISVAHAQLQSAGDVFVNLDATTLLDGSAANLIPNTGTLGGLFEARGGEGNIPVIATEGGTKGIRMDGTDYLQVVAEAGGEATLTPAGLVGADPTRSIEVWALNPDVAGEETLVSWGHRGGPNGSNIAFNYGSDFRWGAVGHWGGEDNTFAPDLGWSNNGGNPEANKWHYLVYTFDGATTRVYSDGSLANAEFLGTGKMNTHADTAINIGAQLEPNGTTVTGGLRGSLTIARVRIHDEVLTAPQIRNNYDFEKAAFINPTPPGTVVPERLVVAPLHRYSFNETAADDASGLPFSDSIGSANGQVLGAGASFTGTRLRLEGGLSGTAAYGDLPNGLLSSNAAANGGTGEFTIEGWFRHTGSRTWARLFDIGSSAGGEVTGPGGGGNGLDYLEWSAQVDNNTASHRLEVRNADPTDAANGATSDIPTTTFGSDFHWAVSWKESTGDITAFENGVRVGGVKVGALISDINDVNVWLGRSNWTADQNVQGEFDEVRFYNHVLTPGEALGNYLAGAPVINNADAAVTIVSNPENRTAPDAGTVSFSVAANGSTPYFFQWLRNGVAIPGATARTLSFNASSVDNGATYSCVVSNVVAGALTSATSTAATLTVQSDTVTLRHRYSFNGAGGNAVAEDSVGTANGEILGGAVLSGDGSVTLDGVDGYINLPNGIISALGNATFETWFTYGGGGAWSRVFDFGHSAEGEDVSGTGVDFLCFASKIPAGFPRFFANQPNGGDATVLSPSGSLQIGTETHLVITYNSAASSARLYLNGVLESTGPASFPLTALNDINNWLGRSQFNDPYFTGSYNEFRIYNGAMSESAVAASLAAGPNPGGPQDRISITASAAGKALLTWPASTTAQLYVLESTESLAGNITWTTAAEATTPNPNGTISATVNTTSTQRYFRIIKK